MPKKGEKRIDGSVDGLADAFDCNRTIRRRTLKSGSVLTWPDTSEKGVINLANVALNGDTMEILINIWAPQWSSPIMIPVDQLKHEAGWYYQLLNT